MSCDSLSTTSANPWLSQIVMAPACTSLSTFWNSWTIEGRQPNLAGVKEGTQRLSMPFLSLPELRLKSTVERINSGQLMLYCGRGVIDTSIGVRNRLDALFILSLVHQPLGFTLRSRAHQEEKNLHFKSRTLIHRVNPCPLLVRKKTLITTAH